MRESTIVATFLSDVQKVWDIVTTNNKYDWRSDLAKIEVADDQMSFTEYTKNGYCTNFTITKKKQYERYEFDMKNKHISGHWIGIFSRTSNGGTQIQFTEQIKFVNPMMQLISYVFMNIKKMQKNYVADLRKALGE